MYSLSTREMNAAGQFAFRFLCFSARLLSSEVHCLGDSFTHKTYLDTSQPSWSAITAGCDK